MKGGGEGERKIKRYEGGKKTTERNRGKREREDYHNYFYFSLTAAGQSLRSAGGESFEAAVKEISTKSLSVTEGKHEATVRLRIVI